MTTILILEKDKKIFKLTAENAQLRQELESVRRLNIELRLRCEYQSVSEYGVLTSIKIEKIIGASA